MWARELEGERAGLSKLDQVAAVDPAEGATDGEGRDHLGACELEGGCSALEAGAGGQSVIDEEEAPFAHVADTGEAVIVGVAMADRVWAGA